LIGYFDDPKMGFVQVPHTTYNLDNFMGRWKSASKAYWEDVRLFFESVQLGKNRFGLACFCGSAAIFRRKAVEEVGGFATETITEDMHTGMRLHAAGWKSLAVAEEMVVGLAPDDAATFANQRLRWGEGNLSVFAYDNPLTMKGLTLAGRINYLASMASWTMGPARLILYLTPLIMLLTGVAPVADMSLTYFAVVGCYLTTVWTAVKIASNRCGHLLGIELAMMASFHLQLQALWRAVFRRRRQKFLVTRKGRRRSASGLRRMWPQAVIVVASIVAVAWAASRTLFGISNDYLCLGIGGGLAVYHSWLALVILRRATSDRDGEEQWYHPLCLAADYSLGGIAKSGVSIECNENRCRLLTWAPLAPETPLEITFSSPLGTAACGGRVVSTTSMGGRRPFAHLSNVVFEHPDPAQRERESDALRRLILRYVVPVVTMEHRIVHQGGRSLPEELSGEADLAMPVTIDARLPNLPVQKSVALSLGYRGFLASLETPCPERRVVQVDMATPLGPLTTEATVYDVETIRVGADVVYEHEFHWSDGSVIYDVMRQKKRWRAALGQAVSHFRNHRRHPVRAVVLQLAAALLAALTVFIYSELHQADILFAIAGSRPMTFLERTRVERTIARTVEFPNASADRLLRVYQAADAIGDHARAAEAAGDLSQRLDGRDRLDWMLTQARHLAQARDTRAADAAFDRLLDQRIESSLPSGQRAEVYIEAARAAAAVNDLDKAVDRFLQAADERKPDPEQAEELLGLLIAAKRQTLALQVLRQLEPTDRVLRDTVNVYEMTGQPEDAVSTLEELYRRHPEDARTTQRLAELAVVRRDFAAGSNYYRALSALEPDNSAAKAKLAETLLLEAREEAAARRLDRAGALFDESFAIQPPSDALKREYAGFLATAGAFQRAISLLEPMKDRDSQLQLAAVLEMNGDNRRALQILMRLEGDRPLGDTDQRSIARLLLASHEYDLAANRLLDLLRKSPDDAVVQRELLDAAAAASSPNEAVRQAVLAVYRRNAETEFQGFDREGFERLSDALRQLGLFQEAGDALEKGVAAFPESRRLRFALAQTLGNLGRYDDADSQYRILLKSSPLLRR
jgi:tetratricopeptide (TPR) repeat protein